MGIWVDFGSMLASFFDDFSMIQTLTFRASFLIVFLIKKLFRNYVSFEIDFPFEKNDGFAYVCMLFSDEKRHVFSLFFASIFIDFK